MDTSHTVEPPVDRAGKDYWDRAWQTEEFPADIEPTSKSIWAHRDQCFHASFRKLFRDRPAGTTLLELGAARSAWLPYFARHFRFSVAGLDYSELGAQQCQQRLDEAGIRGESRCADLFRPPSDWLHAFDIVTWFGVAEHFEHTAAGVRAAAAFVRPGGLLVTEIPNLVGINGVLQRALNKPVYDIHVPLSASALARAHEAAGLRVVTADYVVPTDFGVIDLEGLPRTFATMVKQRFMYALRLLSGCIWWVDRRLGPLPTGRLTSGFIIVAAQKMK